MSEKAISCPNCRAQMTYRLGEYECPGCGHRQTGLPSEEARQPSFGQTPSRGSSARQEKPQERFQNSSGQLLGRDANSYGGGWTPGQVPQPPPPASGGYNLGGLPPEGLYDADKVPAASPGLALEKNIYFGISAGGAVLSLLGSFDHGIGGFIGSLFWTGVNLFLLWFVLHSEELWAKWTCGGCTMFAWLSLLGVMFMPGLGLMGMLENSMPFSSVLGGAVAFVLILRALWDLWLLSILWRDIQARQGVY